MSNDSNISPREAAEGIDPGVGAGSPDTAPWVEPAVPWLKRQPVLAALIAANVPLLVGFVGSLEEGAPWWVQVLIGFGVLVLNGAGAAARQAVTPTAKPRLEADVPLVPARDGEAGHSLIELVVGVLLVLILVVVLLELVR